MRRGIQKTCDLFAANRLYYNVCYSTPQHHENYLLARLTFRRSSDLALWRGEEPWRERYNRRMVLVVVAILAAALAVRFSHRATW